MDLIRAILLQIEEKGEPELRLLPKFENVEAEKIIYHIRLMIEAGLVSAIDTSTLGGEDYMQIAMTWDGHEFLEKVRDPEIWRKTKEGAGKVGSYSIGIMAEIAKGLVLANIRSLGIPL